MEGPRVTSSIVRTTRSWLSCGTNQLAVGLTGYLSYANTVPVAASATIPVPKQIIPFYYTVAELTTKGTVWIAGENNRGQGAQGSILPQVLYEPAQVPLENVAAIAATGTVCCALLEDGTLRTWGGNNYGQLGIGKRPIGFAKIFAAGKPKGSLHFGLCAERVIPGATGIPSPNGYLKIEIKASGTPTIAIFNEAGSLLESSGTPELKTMKALYEWGLTHTTYVTLSPRNVADYAEQEGDALEPLAKSLIAAVVAVGWNAFGEYEASVQTPTLPEGVQSIAAAEGAPALYAITTGGKLYVAGEANGGFLGLGEEWEENGCSAFTEVPGLTGVIGVAGGGLTENGGVTVVLKSNGTVWTTGRNNYGQQGHGSTSPGHYYTFTEVSGLSNVVQVDAGKHAAYALRADGTLYGWGNNILGCLRENVEKRPCGEPKEELLTSPTEIATGVTSIAAASNRIFALKGRKLYGGGETATGQLGLEQEGEEHGKEGAKEEGWPRYQNFPTLVPGAGNNVEEVVAGAFATYCRITEPAGAPPVSYVSKPGAILLMWTESTATTYHVEYRVATEEEKAAWTVAVSALSKLAREYEVTGLTSGVLYEVKVGGSASFVARTIRGRPL